MRRKKSGDRVLLNKKGRCGVRTIIVQLMVSMLLTGCGSSQRELARINRDIYEKEEYPIVYVQRGTVTNNIQATLMLENYQETNFGFTLKEMDSDMIDDLQFDKLNVKIGDYVKQGDILAELKCPSLDADIEKYTKEKKLAEMQKNHLNIRCSIDPGENNDMALNTCEETISVASGYLEELERKKDSLIIRSDVEGKVISISDDAMSGVIHDAANLVTIASGDDTYYLETEEPTSIKEGQTVVAYNDFVEHKVTATKVEKSNQGSKIHFKIEKNGDDLLIIKGLSVDIVEDVRENVLYVPQQCVFEKDEQYFVFMTDDNQARIAREIQVDEILGDYVIVKEGLNEGDEIIAK